MHSFRNIKLKLILHFNFCIIATVHFVTNNTETYAGRIKKLILTSDL